MPRARSTRTESAFGEWLQREMRLQGLNQSELAARVGVSHSTVSRWIGGRRPEVTLLERIADVLVIDHDVVLTAAGYRPRESGSDMPAHVEELLLPLMRQVDWDRDPRRVEAIERDLRWFIEQDKENR